MNEGNVYGVYFSPTGTTEKVVKSLSEAIAEKLQRPYQNRNFTLPKMREDPLVFEKSDIVVFGVPVYAGRVPNVLLKYLETMKGNGAMAIPVVLYGNRDYDDALIELRDILEKSGMYAIGAGAFVGTHAFSYILASGRPDAEDMKLVRKLGEGVVEKIRSGIDPSTFPTLEVKGVPYPYRGYYQPRDRKGQFIDIRKVTPCTSEDCIDCKLCVRVCPMGSISYDDVHRHIGICIKCGACIKKCPMSARYYEDEGYLYHKEELEEGLKRRGLCEIFL